MPFIPGGLDVGLKTREIDGEFIFGTPDATPEDFVYLHSKIEADIITQYKGEYTIEWVDEPKSTSIKNDIQSLEPTRAFVVKNEEGDTIFTASQNSANFSAPVNMGIVESYLTAMKGKIPVIVVNNCANLELAKTLHDLATKVGVKVEFEQKVIEFLKEKSEDSFNIVKLPVYTPPEPNQTAQKKSSPKQ